MTGLWTPRPRSRLLLPGRPAPEVRPVLGLPLAPPPTVRCRRCNTVHEMREARPMTPEMVSQIKCGLCRGPVEVARRARRDP